MIPSSRGSLVLGVHAPWHFWLLVGVLAATCVFAVYVARELFHD